MVLARTLALAALLTLLAGCAGGRLSATDAVVTCQGADGTETPIYGQVDAGLARQIRLRLAGKRFDRIVHIHFRGNEFFGGPPPRESPLLFDAEATTRLAARGEPIAGLIPGRPYVVRSGVAPRIVYHNANEAHLGSFEFRYSDAGTAVEFLGEVLHDPEEDLQRTLLIISGGSHGVDEAMRFQRILQRRYGKLADIVVAADSFRWPALVRLTRFEPMSDAAVGIHLFQTNTWLRGSPIRGFYNIRIETDRGHVFVANESRTLARAIASHLRLDSPADDLASGAWLPGETVSLGR